MVEETKRKEDEHKHDHEYEYEHEPEPELGRRLLLVRASVRPVPSLSSHSIYLKFHKT